MIEIAERLELNAEFLAFHGVIPIGHVDGGYRVGTWKENVAPRVIDDIRLLVGVEPVLETVPEDEARDAITRVYAPESVSAEEIAADLSGEVILNDDAAIDDLVHLANEAPVIKLVNILLMEALEARASDVHIESTSIGLRTRYRVDGVLQDAVSPPANMRAAILSRLKIMAELDIAERRVPQDGRIRLHLRQRNVDVRVSTIPTLHGESVVLRLLDKSRGRIQIADLGMSAAVEQSFRSVISRPHGIVLVTGPTGSGKTTTLYAALDAIRTGSEKILTVEDPVEYELAGVPQMQINEKTGLTFAGALRALLRQDPDIIMVGEIRDGETAEIATQAAMTGHLVLSTLHTNDAVTALTRLIDLGVPPHLVSSTVEGVLAQRLVRMICVHCQISDTASCSHCRGTGFYGRTGIYEMVAMTEELRSELIAGRSADEMRKTAATHGIDFLRGDGMRLVTAGVTTLEEVLRATRI
jgi:general secretion pathway protein E